MRYKLAIECVKKPHLKQDAVEKIIALENIEAAAEDIEKEFADMAEQYKLDVEKIKELIPEDAVTEQIKRRAASKLVIDSAVATEPKEEEKTEDNAEGEQESAE